jgi:hypothetical protein
MFVIYWSVRRIEEKATQWTFEHSMRTMRTHTTSSTGTGNSTRTNSHASNLEEGLDTGTGTQPDASSDIQQSTPIPIPIPQSIQPPQTSSACPLATGTGTEESNTTTPNPPIRLTLTLPRRASILSSNNNKKSPSQRQQSNCMARTTLGMSREVGIQGICFILAFLLTWTVPTIARCIMRFGDDRSVGIEWYIAVNFFLPLQGFFNFLVYLQPKLRKTKLCTTTVG